MHFKTRLLKVFCYCFVFSIQSLVAQVNAIKVVPLLDNALPVKINCVYKTKTGRIFNGTEKGLYKFDGPHYHQILFKDSVIDSEVTAIFEDAANILWVGYKNGCIAKITDTKLEVFKPEEGTPKKTITGFIADKQNNLWFSTDGEGIYYFKGSHLYNINSNDGLSDDHIHALQLTEKGDVLAASDQGINICTIINLNKKVAVLNSTKGLPDNLVTCITPAGKNIYWIGLQDRGYCLYNHATKQFSQASVNWDKGQVNALLYTDNCLRIGTENQGLIKVINPLYSFVSYPENVHFKNPISSLLEDDEGNIWICANNEMIRTNGEKLRLITLPETKIFDNIRAILVDNKNYLWVASENALIKYSNSTELKLLQKIVFPEISSINDITTMYQDVLGTIWIGTMGRGVFLFNPVTNKYRRLQENLMLKNANILSISGKGNAVSVSSFEGIVAFILTEANSDIYSNYYSIDYKNIKGIGSNYVYSIFTDSKNRLWFATDGKGITMLNKGTYTNYNEKNGIKNNVIYSITEDKNGGIWFSTATAGVYKFDGYKFTNYSVSEGLSSLNIANIKTDKEGNIVIVGKTGIDIINPVTNAVTSFTGEQGINEIKDDPSFVTEDTLHNILFCTDNGIGIYSSIKNALQQPQTFIENISLFLEDIGPNPKAVFTHDQNNLTFYFFGFYYSNPDKVQYQYKLDGYDSKWISTKDNEAPFAKLPPGNYTFRVRSSLSSNFANASEATYEFTIESPFWRRWWFILLSLTAIGYLIAWYIKRRERGLKKIEQLNQEKIQFQFQELRNQINPHFLFNSFNTLISTIEEDPKAAVEYTEHLSDFFRNIITYKDKDVITLKEEFDLMNNYLFMQQKRYGQNVQLKINITPEEQSGIYIPPLILQLLTENAIKHNAISKENPLLIDIFIDSDRLVIKNNINRLINKQVGTGIGLQNIINRYYLLSNKKVLIENNDGFFIVLLPVLKKEYEKYINN